MYALMMLAAVIGYQDTAGLDRAVAAFTGHGVGAEGGARTTVDARLRLAACPTVALSWRSDAHDAVVVACSGPDWRLYVPVRTASIAAATSGSAGPVERPVPVIRRGDPIMVEAGDAAFSVTRDGVAMADAAIGARLMVRVEPNKPPVQAIAISAGRATLPGGSE